MNLIDFLMIINLLSHILKESLLVLELILFLITLRF